MAALLLQQQGYKVEGLFMKNWDEDDGTEYCTAKQDLEDARAVSERLGIKLHSANFAAEYWDNVFEHFLSEYKAGRTPNPDILCNKEIKFKAFLEYAQHLGADYIATGHYARLQRENGKTRLLRGLDENKDQSYFLHAVSGTQLGKALFPVGELKKPAVRQLAQQHNLITHDKKDSTGICFIGERRFKDFLEQYLPAQSGDIVSSEGELIGQHQGLMYHTIGQRQGLGIGGIKGQPEAPWYVARKDLANNQLIVVQGADHPLLFSAGLTVDSIDWITKNEVSLPYQCTAKIRYRQTDQRCTITPAESGYRVLFDRPQRAVAAGQSAVFYNQDVCLGGGVITQTISNQ